MKWLHNQQARATRCALAAAQASAKAPKVASKCWILVIHDL